MSLALVSRAQAVVALSFVSLLFALPLRAQTDDPTLINITPLEQLDAIRYDLDGDGTPSDNTDAQDAYEAAFGLASGAVISCAGGCTGYELRESLDFEDADGDGTADDKSIWAVNAYVDGTDTNDLVSGAVDGGWLPIGDASNPFIAALEGNDNTISNLYIDRTGDRAGCLTF